MSARKDRDVSCEAMQSALESGELAAAPQLREHVATCADCAAHERLLAVLAGGAAEPSAPPALALVAHTRMRASRVLRAHAAAPTRGLLAEGALALAVLTLALPLALAHAWLVAEGAVALLGGWLPPLVLEGLGVVYFGSLALAVGALYALLPLWVATLRRARMEAA